MVHLIGHTYVAEHRVLIERIEHTLSESHALFVLTAHVEVVRSRHTYLLHRAVGEGIFSEGLCGAFISGTGLTRHVGLVGTGVVPEHRAVHTGVVVEPYTATCCGSLVAHHRTGQHLCHLLWQLFCCHVVVHLFHVYRTTVLGRVVLHECATHHGSCLQIECSTALRGSVVLQDAVAYVTIVSHDGSSAILLIVDAVAAATSCLCLSSADEDTVHHGTVRHSLFSQGEQTGISERRHPVVGAVLQILYLVLVIICIGVAVCVEYIVCEGHHVVGGREAVLYQVFCQEVGLVACDVAHAFREGCGIISGYVVGIATPYLHASGHHDGVLAKVYLCGFCRAQGSVAQYVVFAGCGEGCQLHNHLSLGMQELVASGSVEHLLQLLPAGCVGWVLGRRGAKSILCHIVDGCSQLALHIGRDAVGTVVFIGSYVYRTVLHTVCVVHIHIGQRHVLAQVRCTSVHTVVHILLLNAEVIVFTGLCV